MSSRDHNFSSQTCQEIVHVFCQKKTNCGCHFLSKSSSALANTESSQSKPEIHKSLNNITYVAKCNENSVIQNSHSSQWSLSMDGSPNLNPEKSDCNHFSVSDFEEKMHPKIHYLSDDSSLATAEQEIKKIFARYKVSENISLLDHSQTSMCKVDSMDNLNSPGLIVQKSFSDYSCGSRTSVPHSIRGNNTISAAYSNLSASSSISGSGSDGTCTLSNFTQDSGIDYSPSNLQNNLTDVYSDMEPNIPLSHLDSSTIQHNISVHTVLGAYQHGVFGHKDPRNVLPSNEYMCCQPYYNISSVMSCDDISESKLPPLAMIIHDSCSVHCSKEYEPLLKVDDATAACCHSLPISSIQYSSRQEHSLVEPVLGHTVSQFCSQLPAPDKFLFPKLVSSVSESGLETKKLLRCGRFAFPPPPVSMGENNLLTYNRNTSDLLLKTVETPLDILEIPDSDAKTKDTWTMTSKDYLSVDKKSSLKDAEVQTVIVMESKAVSTTSFVHSSSHLFPDIGLGINLHCPQSPVREVRWDNEGMTWEVYGAAVDPEVLGLAIQKHLEIQIEQNTQPSEQSGENEQSNKEKRRSIRTVMQSLRQSNCCVCTTAMSD
ncbi:G protein-regulated inducer of neurite outgrowth 2 [Dendrobates tinctorius]|uniref:G protein-regulated inducer of neurite outgrowth 2 n=1 Tax=Dendrobates tinctorius TaxID=92724 RepID=UPI003CC93000